MKNAFQIHHKTIICVAAFVLLAIVIIALFATDIFPADITDLINRMTENFDFTKNPDMLQQTTEKMIIRR